MANTTSASARFPATCFRTAYVEQPPRPFASACHPSAFAAVVGFGHQSHQISLPCHQRQLSSFFAWPTQAAAETLYVAAWCSRVLKKSSVLCRVGVGEYVWQQDNTFVIHEKKKHMERLSLNTVWWYEHRVTKGLYCRPDPHSTQKKAGCYCRNS